MKLNLTVNTDGKGGNTDEIRSMIVSHFGFGYQSTTLFPDDPWTGEVRVYFDSSGFVPGSWHVPGYGLICGDKLWLKEFKAGLAALGFSRRALQALKYNDKKLQGNDYVSLDAGTPFYASWKRITKLIERNTLKEPELELIVG